MSTKFTYLGAGGFGLLIFLFFPAAVTAGSIHGTVVDGSSGKPVSDVIIELRDTSFRTSSNKSGSFSIAPLMPGNYRLRATRPGYELLELEITVTDEAPEEVELVIRPTLIRIHEEVVVTAQRMEARPFDVPEAVSTLEQSQLNRKALRSTPEALTGVTGVWMQKTNHGGGSAFLRGLTGNQTLLMIDGIRLNNATFRYGPNQYLNTIAPNAIERAEVIRGTGSVLYGSDALGGVIHLLSKTPRFSSQGVEVSGAATLRYMSFDMDRSARAELQVGSPRWAVRGGLDVRHFGDLVAGGDLGTESPSGYDEISGDIKGQFQLSGRHLMTLAYQHVNQDDVPRFDQVAERGYLRYSFDPQIRQLAYARSQSFFDNRWFREMQLTFSLNRSIEERVKQKRNQTLIQNERDEVDTLGLSLEIHSSPRPNWSMVSGLELYHDTVGSWANQLDTSSGAETQSRGLYPDGSTASSLAFYSLSTFSFDRWDLTVGGRFNAFTVNAEDELFGDLHIDPKALVGNLSVLYKLHRDHHLVGSIHTGFRAPNINDLSSFGSFDFGTEVPSADLSPERSLTFELGHKTSTERFSSSVALYWTRLFDLITRVESTYQGSPIYEGEQVYKKENVTEAHIYGVEGDFEMELTSRSAAFGSLVYTYGQNVSQDEPMRRIPPLYGRLGLRFEDRSGLWSEAEWRFATKQDRLSSGDVADHRIPPGGTLGWNVINLRLGYEFPWFTLNGGLQNLLNEAYRIHGSGVDGYGRSGWIAIRLRF